MRKISCQTYGGSLMHPADLLTGADAGLLMFPFFALLALWVFHLDKQVAAPRRRSTRRPFCEAEPLEPGGLTMLSDPDGQTWVAGPSPKVQPEFLPPAAKKPRTVRRGEQATDGGCIALTRAASRG